jgi:CubicO group peptidase (beta-lactamase class C family)
MPFSSLSYLKRFIFWNYPGINDYKKFPYNEISCEGPFFTFNKDEAKEGYAADILREVEYQYKNKKLKFSFENLLISTGTTAFIIIKNDTVLYEKYFNKYSRESVNTSFSTSKSFTSALIGIAIDEGYIKSLDDKVIDWLPELKHRVSDSLSVRHLISMSSGIKYNHSYYPWADEAKSYHYPDLRKLVLSLTMQEHQPGLYFKYSNYNTILLGIILERSTNTAVSELLQNKIWKPIGMEFPASWSTDSRKNKFPKMESGINARSIDFAKFGRLFLNSGRWGNNQIISDNWIKESTSPLDLKDIEYYFSKNYYPYSMFFNDKQLYYKYGWWGLKLDEEHYDFMAIGNLGQFIYVSPQKSMIIVRNGSKWGQINWWPGLFKRITEIL